MVNNLMKITWMVDMMKIASMTLNSMEKIINPFTLIKTLMKNLNNKIIVRSNLQRRKLIQGSNKV